MRKYLLPLLILLMLVAASCGDDDDTSAGGDGDAVTDEGDGATGGIDGSWVLTSGTVDGTELALIESNPITMVIEGTTVSGTSACNTYSGTLSVEDGTAALGPFVQTEMACEPAEAMTLEAAYLAALSTGTAIGTEGENLVVSSDTVTLTYAPAAAVEAAPLVGGEWQMDSIITGDAVSTTVGTAGTITFAEDGTVSGSTGCNTFNGTYEAADGVITFGPLATTRKGCPDDLGAQEAHVLGVLGATPTYTIDGTSLTLMAGDGNGLGYTAQG
jgi:heat shock protein HslJ